MPDTAADGYQKQRTDHVEKREATRPAIRRDHLMQIYPRPKETERVSDERSEHTGGYDPPTIENAHVSDQSGISVVHITPQPSDVSTAAEACAH